MKEYTIVADYNICGKACTCLVCLCGTNKERAEEILSEILAGAPYRLQQLGKGVNPRIEVTEEKEQWWHKGGLD